VSNRKSNEQVGYHEIGVTVYREEVSKRNMPAHATFIYRASYFVTTIAKGTLATSAGEPKPI